MMITHHLLLREQYAVDKAYPARFNFGLHVTDRITRQILPEKILGFNAVYQECLPPFVQAQRK